MNLLRAYLIGFALIVAGFAIILLGGAGSSSSSSFAGVVFIGPIPIVFGSGPGSGILALIALVATIGIIIVFYLSATMRGRKYDRSEFE